MDEYQIPERANKVERETAEQRCSFCQGQMARAALDAARPLCLSGRDMHTARRRNYLSLFVQKWSKRVVCLI